MTITRERLEEIAEDGFLKHGESKELARIALASLEAEPVAWISERNLKNLGKSYSVYVKHEPVMVRPIPLYTAPPAPVAVPDERAAFNAWNNDNDCPLAGRDAKTAAWLAWSHRAAMLQGADGNSPVIPDGWVLVPVEPTEKMVIEGFESEPDEFFSKSEEWEAYQKMSGCEQAAHRAKLCWAAMIAAAPQQEV